MNKHQMTKGISRVVKCETIKDIKIYLDQLKYDVFGDTYTIDERVQQCNNSTQSTSTYHIVVAKQKNTRKVSISIMLDDLDTTRNFIEYYDIIQVYLIEPDMSATTQLTNKIIKSNITSNQYGVFQVIQYKESPTLIEVLIV